MDFNTAFTTLSLMDFLTMFFTDAPADWVAVYPAQVIATLCVGLTAVSALIVFSKNGPVRACAVGMVVTFTFLAIWAGSPDRVLRSAVAAALAVGVMQQLVAKAKRDVKLSD